MDDDEESCIKGFHISLSWDYPDDWCLKDVQDNIFHVYHKKDAPRSESQYITECVQLSGAGVILIQPTIGKDIIPSEVHFTAIPNVAQYYIEKIVVVSEAKHLELYLDDMYESTSKGCMLTMKKGKKAALYENEFELSAHAQGMDRISLKFLSLAEKGCMRLQSIIVKINEYATDPSVTSQQTAKGQSSMDIDGVKSMMQAMGISVSNGAQKLMSDIEQQQKQRQFMQLQGIAQLGLLANTQLLNSAHQQPQVTPSAQDLFASMLQLSSQQQGVPNYNPLMQQAVAGMNPLMQSTVPSISPPVMQQTVPSIIPLMHQAIPNIPLIPAQSSGKALPTSLFPVSRESSVPHVNRRVQRHRSLNSFDKFNGYGMENPPNESVLINAMMNSQQARVLAESRATKISEANYERTQMELVKKFLKSQDATKFSITKSNSLKTPAKPPRMVYKTEKQRPHSLAALPSTSEVDFTRLLTGLMNEEEEKSSTSSSRWETYLRSRVRAGQRISTTSLGDENENEYQRMTREGHLENENGFERSSRDQCLVNDNEFHRDSSERRIHSSSDSGGTFSPQVKLCGECGRTDTTEQLNELIQHMVQSEQRIMDQMDSKLHELRSHLDLRLDSLYDTMVALHPENFVDANNYSDCQDTEV